MGQLVDPCSLASRRHHGQAGTVHDPNARSSDDRYFAAQIGDACPWHPGRQVSYLDRALRGLRAMCTIVAGLVPRPCPTRSSRDVHHRGRSRTSTVPYGISARYAVVAGLVPRPCPTQDDNLMAWGNSLSCGANAVRTAYPTCLGTPGSVRPRRAAGGLSVVAGRLRSPYLWKRSVAQAGPESFNSWRSHRRAWAQ